MRTSWLFDPEDLEKTPTRMSGIDGETERRYRREGVRLIFDVGAALNLDPHPTLATAAVYFHRFFMTHSFANFNRYTTALSCLFLAGKVEETPKKCRDIVVEAKKKFSEEQWTRMLKGSPNMLEEVMMTERVLLQTIKFDLHVYHPYQFLLRYAKIFRAPKEAVSLMVQAAWTFVNDSMCTSLCLLFEPEVIAIALMYLASRFSKVDLSDWEGKRTKNDRWWDSFVENMDKSVLEEICHTVLDFYSAGASAGAGVRNAAIAVSSANNNVIQPTTSAQPTTQTVTRSHKIQPHHVQTTIATTSHYNPPAPVQESYSVAVNVSVPPSAAPAPIPSMGYPPPPMGYPPPIQSHPPPNVQPYNPSPSAQPRYGQPPRNPHMMRSNRHHPY